jgi:hypothetical protein
VKQSREKQRNKQKQREEEEEEEKREARLVDKSQTPADWINRKVSTT